MCTVVILRRPGHTWPLILAANRDEMKGRPWQPPARHWPDRPEVVAGRDELAGGTWLGLNGDGLVAGVLNRRGSLGPELEKRSRGELVLEALDHADAGAAAMALADLDPAAYRTFNLVIADERAAYWLRSLGGEGPGGVEVFPLPPGLSMLTAGDLDDSTSPRIRAHLPRFQAAREPEPETGDWQAWQEILASRVYDAADGPFAAMSVASDMGFETVSSSLIALPSRTESLSGSPRRPIWLFAPGRPDIELYQPITM
jgi:uncharacterized protein with NRDE domain